MPTPLYEQLKKVRAVFLSSMDKEEKANEVALFKQMIKWSDSLGILEPEDAQEITEMADTIAKSHKWNFAMDCYL